MSRPRKAKPAKLVIGLILNDQALLAEVVSALSLDFGAIDVISPWMAFDYTTYYHREMGPGLHRRMVVFENLIEQQDLAKVKQRTNALEARFARDDRRNVNIDPGYLLFERFVLATGKNYAHRIYIGGRIYADLTLVFQQGTYQPLPWTYPDYRDAGMIDFLLQVRRAYGADPRLQ